MVRYVAPGPLHRRAGISLSRASGAPEEEHCVAGGRHVRFLWVSHMNGTPAGALAAPVLLVGVTLRIAGLLRGPPGSAMPLRMLVLERSSRCGRSSAASHPDAPHPYSLNLGDAMSPTLLVHIIAGTLGLLSGYLALYSTKGEPLHRRAGIVFVYAMLTMTATGFVVAVAGDVAPAVNVPAAVLTAYLVVTALATVRPPARGERWLDRGGLITAAGVGAVSLTFAVQAITNGGTRNGMPAFPFMMFGVVAVIAVVGDVRVIRSGPRRGRQRLARHLWRMSFALFIAALSFFIGQAAVIPTPLRKPLLLATPVLAVLVTMFYWLWRVRARPIVRRARVVDAPAPPAARQPETPSLV